MIFIAEIGPANGDLGYAHEMADRLADLNTSWPRRVWMKGQIYSRDRLVTRDAQRYDRTNHRGNETQWDEFARQLTYDQWSKVADRCAGQGLPFLASPFDLDAVTFLASLAPPAIKIASGDLTHRPLLEAAAETGIPLIVSTGGAYPEEVMRARGWLGGVDVTWLACTLAYPCRLEDANVGRMQWLKQLGPVGYSDHTEGWGAATAARDLGARYVEKHVTLTPGEGGDHDFAATPDQVRRFAFGHMPYAPWILEDDEWNLPSEQAAREGARRSCVAARDLPEGHMLNRGDIDFLRPAGGTPPHEISGLLGLELDRDVAAGEPL